MAAVNNIPREIQDSIRDVIDRRLKFSIKRMVRQEVRPEKLENRVLAFSPCRLYILAARTPTKLEHSFHFLDIQAIESRKPNQMVLTVEGKMYTFVTMEPETEEIDHMITHIGKSLKQIFPSFPLERLIVKIDVTPPERLKIMHDMIKDLEGKDVGPCGGYASMYACMCDYHSLPYRDEVAWDVDTIYLSQDSRELCLRDFDHLNGKDLVPIISALEHNCWFTKLNANGVKLTSEAASEVLKVMKRNSVIEELALSNTGIKVDFIQKLSTALLSNSGSQLSRVDLSNNFLEDRGIHHLMGSLSNQAKGLVYLDLSKTGMTSKGLGRIAETMSGSANMSTTLKTLKVAENGQKGEDLTQLYNFLAQPNALTHLDMSYTDCAIDMLFSALQRGSSQSLVHLNVSHTTFTHKKMKDVQVPASLKQFFASACMLDHVDLSSCRLPPEAVKELLLGISSNRHIHNLHLDLSSNELQGQGAHNIAGCISQIKNIVSLDISNNGFDTDLKHLLPEIARCQSLKHLAVGRNFQGVKPKHILTILDPVVQLVQDDECGIESLSLADSRLRAETAYVINALGSNTSLTAIDISGNQMGDMGARMLAKALQINSHLRTILWDRNNTTAQGFEDLAEALEKNFTLRKMPFPVNDAAVTMKTQTERTETALQKIESLLQRNHSPRKCASDQLYRLQQGFLISSTQQMVDRLVVQVQDTVNALSFGPSENFKEDMEHAGLVIKDADNSKQLLPRLQSIAIKSQDAGNPVEVKLQEIANNLRQVMEEQMKKTMEEMLKCTTTHCSGVMEDQGFKASLEEHCEEKSTLPQNFTKIVLDGVSTDVFNKLSELNLAVAAHISDQVVEEVIENLSKSHKMLTNHLNLRRSGHYKESPVKSADKTETDNEKDGDVERRPSTAGPSLYTGASYLHGSPKLTSKRKSMYGRKLRPQSVIDRERSQRVSVQHIDFGDHAPAADVGDAARFSAVPEGDNSELSTSIHEEKLGSLEEVEFKKSTSDISLGGLDTQGPPPTLQHLNKARPKRAKNKPPTRPVAPSVLEEVENDGISAFYQSRPASKDSLASAGGDQTKHVKREDSTSASPKEEPPKPETKKRNWFSKDKDKGAAKDKEKKEKSSKTSGFANFFHRKSGGKAPVELLAKDKKSEAKSETRAETKTEPEPTKLEVVEESKPLTELTKPKEVKPEPVKTKDVKQESVKSKESKQEALKPKEVKQEALKPKEVKQEALKPKEVKQEALKPKEVKQEALKPKEVKQEALKPKEVKAETCNGQTEETAEDKSKSEESIKTESAPLAEAESSRDDEDEDDADTVAKLPAGVPKIGLGGNLLAEMKMKQEKRLSQRFPPHGPAPPVPSEKSETNNNIGEKSEEAKGGNSEEPKATPRAPLRSGTVQPKNPTPAPRAMIPPKRSTIVSSNPTPSADGDAPMPPRPAARPVPPRKPPQLPPKPRNSLKMAKDSPTEEEGPSSSPDKKPDTAGEVVVDSATLRLTVKQKAERISRVVVEDDPPKVPPLVKKKTSSLPRDSDASDDSKDDAKSDSSVLTADDGESGSLDAVDAQSKDSDSKSDPVVTPDPESEEELLANQEEKGPEAKADVDEIMV